MRKRDYAIDWLRVIGMLGIFSFHVARFFNEEDWHVKNLVLDEGLSIYVGILNQFIMPLFFVVSAIATFYAFQRRNSRQFLRERVNRLLVPLIFGIFVLIPPQVYIERLTHGQFVGSFFAWLPLYFEGWYGFGGNFAWMGLHLWYLLILFLFSLVLLPLFIAGSRASSIPKITFLADWFSRAPWLFALFVPLSLVEILVNRAPETFGRREFGGWSPLSYLVIFLLGYLIATDPRYGETIRKRRFWFISAALICTFIGYLMVDSGVSTYSIEFSILRGVNTWSWMLAFLGLASQHLSKSNDILNYANLAVLPFYILHQTVIVIVGFFILTWPVNIALKYAFLATASFLIIMALYEGIIRRVPWLYPLFGMRGS